MSFKAPPPQTNISTLTDESRVLVVEHRTGTTLVDERTDGPRDDRYHPERDAKGGQ